VGVLGGLSLGDACAEHLGDEVGLGGGQAGELVAQRAGQFHHPVSVQQPFGDQCCRVGQGGDVGTGEDPLIVGYFGESEGAPQSACFLGGNAGPLGDVQSGVAPVPIQQPAGDDLPRWQPAVRGIRWLRRRIGFRVGVPEQGQQRREETVAAQSGQLADRGSSDVEGAGDELHRAADRIDHFDTRFHCHGSYAPGPASRISTIRGSWEARGPSCVPV